MLVHADSIFVWQSNDKSRQSDSYPRLGRRLARFPAIRQKGFQRNGLQRHPASAFPPPIISGRNSPSTRLPSGGRVRPSEIKTPPRDPGPHADRSGTAALEPLSKLSHQVIQVDALDSDERVRLWKRDRGGRREAHSSSRPGYRSGKTAFPASHPGTAT